MSDPLNSAVFGDGSNTISSKIASSGLADMGSGGMSGGVGKPGMGITTQLHTPLPRPSNVSTHSGGSSAASSMEAVNRSRSTVDPLASMTASVEQEEFEHQTPSPEVKAPPVDVYTSQFLSKISTPPINVDLISRNKSGLHILASCNAWKQVIELALELMQGNPVDAYVDSQGSLSVIFIFRMMGLFRLKLLDELQLECCAVLAREESKLLTLITGSEVVIEAERGGSGAFLSYCRPPMNSFRVDNIVSLQLLFVEVKVVTGRGDEALNLLYMLKDWLSTPEEDTSVQDGYSATCSRAMMWKWKVEWALINVLIRQRLWRQSIKEMLSIINNIQKLNEVSGDDGDKLNKKYTIAKVVILCRISRTLIQIGALKSAGDYLDKATTVFEKCQLDSDPRRAVLETHIEITKGLLCFSNDQFVDACDLFKSVIDSAINTRASNFGSMSSATGSFLLGEDRDSEATEDEGQMKDASYVMSPDFSILAHRCAGVVEMEDSLLPIAVNNFAVCSLHLRKIKGAVSKMEELVQDDPPRHMIDPVIFNLCTMYDLSFGPNVSTEKKKTLQQIAEKYNIDDLHWRSFRLN